MTMAIETTELIYLVLGPGVLLLAALLLRTDLRLQGRCATLEQSVTDATAQIEALQRQLAAVRDDERGARDDELEARLAMLSRQQEQLMLRDSETGPYFQAVRQAEQGAGVESLMELAGVTRAEAELIVALHGSK